ncbi:MAG: hypothetical protein H6709_09770 [Kofleriaceae bacterium]|nr:hypothetical protein [Myxococcales bacterium]MCB9562978.1 hypothetical protein [Kofleriaceae bacterium]MCB9572360.1 hypothetical protein [Kofleriaceae bacterium]
MRARGLVLGAAVALVAAIVVVVVRGAGGVPDEPQPVAWDQAVCGHCHMHVGEPRFAAQLITDAGEVVNFDDVGCALRYLRERRPAVHRLWFHGEGDAWIAADRAAFVAAPRTPMGSGLMAVEVGTPGARGLDDVERDLDKTGGLP